MKLFILLLLMSPLFFFSQVEQNNTAANISNSDSLINYKTNESRSELSYAMQPFLNSEKYGLGIIRYYPTDDYSSTGAVFKIFNPLKNTIKYIWFTVAGVNPVGDLVSKGKTVYQTLKAIGPVKKYEVSEWSFDYVWLTNIVETMKISTIKIQYMDNTFRTIKYNENMYIGQDAYERFVTAMYNEDKKEEEQERISRRIAPNDESIFEFVDFIPEFPGGLVAFRSKINSSIETNESGLFNISFIVEKNGTVSNIQVSGSNSKLNEDAVKAVSQIKTLWIPAKIDGVNVRYKNTYQIKID